MNRNIKYENLNTNTAETVQYASSIATGTVNSINSIYKANKSAVVGVRNDGSSTNVFGQAAPT